MTHRKETRDTVRGYVARYEDAAIDSERAHPEAAAASELAQRFLSYREDDPSNAIWAGHVQRSTCLPVAMPSAALLSARASFAACGRWARLIR